ncbi:MAG: dimethylamine monooxygenase subunit DmmA family protein [Arenicella sp.]
MSKFEFPVSIKSRPTYSTLQARPGTHHLFVADAEGAQAIVEVADNNTAMIANAHIIYIPKNSGDSYIAKLEALKAKQLYVGPSFEAALPRLRQCLNNAHTGTQIYLTGTEGLMGQSMAEAINAGIPHTAIQTEHRGSVARRMQCVHCKGITEDVITDPFVCSHCHLNLFVRDHYSRRIAAFQGVCIDAEDPGNVPDAVELYK